MGMQPAELERFEACEHEDLADNVKLHFYGRGCHPDSTNANVRPLNFIKVKLHGHNTRSGFPLTFGQISALAGDFYGIPGQPITLVGEIELGEITDARKERAIAAFNTLGEWKVEDFKKIKNTLLKNLEFINGERATIEKDGKKKSTDTYGIIAYDGFEDAIYDDYKANSNKHLFGYSISDPKHALHLKALLENNYDHFQPYAKVTYEVFHALALEEARKAREGHLTPNDKNEILESAYALEAFGCHFLGDSFASGHMRTPRRELPKSTFGETNGNILVNMMHNEDNEHGLRVTSKKAQREGVAYWNAYGDAMLHHTKSSKNFKFAQRAVQLGVDEVFRASQRGETEMRISDSEVFDFIPYIDPNEKNNTPMFQIINKKVCRRKELQDLQCKQRPIDNWSPVGTLSRLSWYKPQNGVIQKETKTDK